MTVIAFNSEVSAGQLKRYADVICFSQVGVSDAEISERLDIPEHTVSAWIKNWNTMEAQCASAGTF